MKPSLSLSTLGHTPLLIIEIVGVYLTQSQTNSSPLKTNRPKPKRKLVFQPSNFKELLVLGSVYFC